ncbi:hypothetical protein HPB48_004188 [Haemaphysalis longicornis]|uniref:Uncharacterized protein n=1 Tax=Haemaphysalis longicornis TaxID=44386 RepID=A0A9J6GM44_HAELO|nr:hypothetical protein HPB48_004188 [Haemaphysalis longicornis]
MDTSDPHCAKCTGYRNTFDIASMAESALISHANSVNHYGIMQMAAGNSMQNYLAASARSIGSAPSQATDLKSPCQYHDVVMDATILWIKKLITSYHSYNRGLPPWTCPSGSFPTPTWLNRTLREEVRVCSVSLAQDIFLVVLDTKSTEV